MSELAEDPAAQAGARVAQYLSLAAMAAESVLAARAARVGQGAAVERAATSRLRGQTRTAYTAARAAWAPALDPRHPGGRTSAEAGRAWAASQGWDALDPQARRAGQLAELRLRELAPELMHRLDRLRRDGTPAAEALRLAAPALDPDPDASRVTAPAASTGPAGTGPPGAARPGSAAASPVVSGGPEHPPASGEHLDATAPATGPAAGEPAAATPGGATRQGGAGQPARLRRSAPALAADAYPLPAVPRRPGWRPRPAGTPVATAVARTRTAARR